MVEGYSQVRDQLLAAPAISFWLKDTIRAFEHRDPVDVGHDLEMLLNLTRLRIEEALTQLSLSQDAASSPDATLPAHALFDNTRTTSAVAAMITP